MKLPTNLKEIAITTLIWLCAILLAVILISMGTWPIDMDNYTSEWIKLQKSETSQLKQANNSTKNYIEVMTKYWFSEKESKYMISTCSNMNNPDRCVKLATSIAWHETHWGAKWVGRSHKNNLYWMTFSYYNPELGKNTRAMKTYPNRMASFEDWVVKYNQYRHWNNCVEMVSRSRYTTTNVVAWIETCEIVTNKFN